VIEGVAEAAMAQENGAGVVKTSSEGGMMTVFPRGSVHPMQNTGEMLFFLVGWRNGSWGEMVFRMRERDAYIGALSGGSRDAVSREWAV
jgi:hypothetical protein